MKIERRDINPVTQLPALREVIDWFGTSMSTAHADSYLSVIVCEITKYINLLENYGIDAVDEMISAVAKMLQRIWGTGSFIGHISDERFVIIKHYSEKESLDDILLSLQNDSKLLESEVEQYNNSTDKPYIIELDYGYVTAEPGWNGAFESFFKMANSEMLMNHLKKDLNQSNNSKTVLWKYEEVFNLLIEKNLFHYHFQPIVNARNGIVFAYEALMRTDNLINMAPLEVIDVAADLGKLYEIEKVTMRNTMEYLSQNKELFQDRKLFINSIPAYMLQNEDWDSLVKKYGHIMDMLVVEMTEQSEMNDEVLEKFRNRLKKNNISLAIDDYGTGFSNLSNLIRYTPDYVKIDRALVCEINEKPKIQKLVSGIIEFIHENGFVALAEGVETYEELKTMIDLEVDYIQGYYLARPSANIIDKIDDKYYDEIISLNIMRSDYGLKVYTPSENETIYLSQIATQHYNSILIDKENVTIEGIKGTPINCTITVKDGVKCNITLSDVSITTEKETPLVDIGTDCCVRIRVEGNNDIINRGIRVPQGSDLHLSGTGTLNIRSDLMNAYAIGGDKDSTYGNINIERLSQLLISVNGDNCIGIGGGKNPSDSKISIIKSGIRIEIAGGLAVGIGTFEGPARVDMCYSDFDFNMSCANAVGIGSLNGNLQVLLDNYFLNIVESGNNLCGVGSLNNGEGDIKISNGTINCTIRGRSIICLGSDFGEINCELESSSTTFYCEGNTVVGIGDLNGNGNINIHDANLNMTIMAKDILDIGTKSGRLAVMDCKRNIRKNE